MSSQRSRAAAAAATRCAARHSGASTSSSRARRTRSGPKRSARPASCQSSRAARASCGANRPSCWPAATARRAARAPAGRPARSMFVAASRASSSRSSRSARGGRLGQRLLEEQRDGAGALQAKFEHAHAWRPRRARRAARITCRASGCATRNATVRASRPPARAPLRRAVVPTGRRGRSGPGRPCPAPGRAGARPCAPKRATTADASSAANSPMRRQAEDAQSLASLLVCRQQPDRQRREIGGLGRRVDRSRWPRRTRHRRRAETAATWAPKRVLPMPTRGVRRAVAAPPSRARGRPAPAHRPTAGGDPRCPADLAVARRVGHRPRPRSPA